MLKTQLKSPFLSRYGLFIHGKEVVSKSLLEISNPYDESHLCSVSEASSVDVDYAINSGLKTFQSGVWSRSDRSWRFKIMTKIAMMLEARIDDFALKETLQTGRPIKEMKAQLSRIPEWIDYHASLMRTEQGIIPPFKVAINLMSLNRGMK
jgi:acyl-CoA reductase-like NAD-dependent aldehyde dehydrogenase